MKYLLLGLIVSFSFDIPLLSLYKTWAVIRLSDILFVALILVILMRKVIGALPKFENRIPLIKPFTFYFLVCCASSVMTFYFLSKEQDVITALSYTAHWIVRLAQAFLCYYLFVNLVRDDKIMQKCLLVFWISGLFVAAFGFLQYVKVAPILWNEELSLVSTPGAIVSTLSYNHSHIALYMLCMIFMTLGLITNERKYLLKIFMIISLVFFAHSLVFSLKRAAYIAVFVGLLFWLFKIEIVSKISLNKKVVLGFITLIFLSCLLILLMRHVETYQRLNVFFVMAGKGDLADISGSFSDRSFLFRLEILEFYFNLFIKNPMRLIFGFGYLSTPMRYWIGGIHNGYLEPFVDSGIVGLLAYLMIIWIMVKIFWKLSIYSAKYKGLYLAILSLVISLNTYAFMAPFFSVYHTVGSFLEFFLSLLGVIIGRAYWRGKGLFILNPGS